MISLPSDLEEQLEAVSKAERRPMASMCLALIEQALKLPRYREILEREPEDDATIVKEMGLDKLSSDRIKELQVLLEALEKLKS